MKVKSSLSVSNFEEKVFSFLKEYQVPEPGKGIVAGVSGGADSVCLLFLLCKLRDAMGFPLQVVHVNHGIRPEAGEDACFVEELCKRWKVDFHLVEENIPKRAREWKCSEEEAGRRVRYEAFRTYAGETEYIAVAHHRDDHAETILLNLFRGSGIRGLTGIWPVRDRVIRPLLCVSRADIEAYLNEQGMTWREDTTNFTNEYTRNKIRNSILPLTREINSESVSHIVGAADQLHLLLDLQESLTDQAFSACVCTESGAGGYRVDAAAFIKQHPAIQHALLYRLLEELSPGKRDIGQKHVNAAVDLCLRKGNRHISLPFGIVGSRSYETVSFFKEEGSRAGSGIEAFLADQEILDITEYSPEMWEALTEDRVYTKYFDYDKIKRFLSLRTRESGDYITVSDAKGGFCRQSVKSFMINAKIPADQRDAIPMLMDGQHCIWILGYRISECCKITKETCRALKVSITKNESD